MREKWLAGKRLICGSGILMKPVDKELHCFQKKVKVFKKSYAVCLFHTGKRSLQSPNMDKKSPETVFSGDKWQSKTLFLTIFYLHSSIVLAFSIAFFPVCIWFTMWFPTMKPSTYQILSKYLEGCWGLQVALNNSSRKTKSHFKKQDP